MAGKTSSSKKSSSSKSASASSKKSNLKVKDLAPKKDPRGGSTGHGSKKGDY